MKINSNIDSLYSNILLTSASTTTSLNVLLSSVYSNISSNSSTYNINLIDSNFYNSFYIFPKYNSLDSEGNIVVSDSYDENKENKLLQIPPVTNEEIKKHYDNRIINNDRIYKLEETQRKLTLYTPVSLLAKIHNDKDVAIETCLLFLSSFLLTTIAYKNNEPYTINLCSELLEENYGHNYKRIIDVLKYHKIIECDEIAIEGTKSYSYWLSNEYITKNFKSYCLKTKQVKKIRIKQMTAALAKAMDNVIARNTLIMYLRVELPSDKEILAEGKKLVKTGYSRKGVTYKILGKKKRIREKGKRYIEDDLELFHILINPSFIIPNPSDNAGGRVVNTFNLMPNWIRKMVKLDGENTCEIDFSALHPNIASMLYGDGKSVTHKMVAEYLLENKLIDVKTLIEAIDIAKIEHLSFFNKPFKSMKRSVLWNYYMNEKPGLIENLLTDRGLHSKEHKPNEEHKHTSLTFFRIEVAMMTEAMEILSKEGIYSMYVYDALWDVPSNTKRIQDVMQQVADKYNIPTEAKSSYIPNDKIEVEPIITEAVKAFKFDYIEYLNIDCKPNTNIVTCINMPRYYSLPQDIKNELREFLIENKYDVSYHYQLNKLVN